MTDPTNRQPLWEAMDAARFLALHKGCNNGVAVAAELRAIVDAMEDRFGLFSGDALMILHWLRDEADKAEAGG
jgi:hypothetical protein